MGEKQQQPKRFYTIQFPNKTIHCHDENTWIYTFKDEPFADHIFLMSGVNEKGDSVGMILWKQELDGEQPGQWANVVTGLKKIGVDEINEDKMPDNDRMHYVRKFGEIALHEVELVEPHDIGTHQEYHVSYLAHILERGILGPDDFMGNGELFI